MAQDIANALRYLHAQKPAVIHRDIKPANFLVDRAFSVKITDFGLASADSKVCYPLSRTVTSRQKEKQTSTQ